MKTQERYEFSVVVLDDLSLARRFKAKVDATTPERAEQALRNHLKSRGLNIITVTKV